MAVITSGRTPLPSFQTASPVPSPSCSNRWVKLKAQLSEYSFDEALLLCECPDGRWIAWVPDFGEACLSPEQFE
ncbi:hypothetical protein ACN4EG_14340 [Alkalinema pantanalense CENA528]|uniref:hypothetical protein n=1 Tax=Alkalinema pantanalense TaxID=1620705 RepID=UPI003D6F4759